MSLDFPKFVKIQGSDDGESKMTLENAEFYKKHALGILYEDVLAGDDDGIAISTLDQKIKIQYQWFMEDAKLLSRGHFSNSLEMFSHAFSFKADLTEAMMGMRVHGVRRIIIPPEINKTDSYRILDVTLFSIKNTISSNYVKVTFERIVAALGGPQVVINTLTGLGVGPLILGCVQHAIKSNNTGIPLQNEQYVYPARNRSIKETQTQLGMGNQNMYPARNPYINETQTQLGMDNQNTHPAKNLTYINNETKPQPQPMPAGVDPRITYQVVNEGEGEVISKHQQGCFQYKVVGSTEALSNFEGSPTELAIKLGPGFEDAMLEVIVGMKINGRRIIIIPHKVSNFGEESVLDLKLMAIKDLNLRCRI